MIAFTEKPLSDAALMTAQGITGAQGLDALSDPEWDDDTDDAYFRSLT